MSIVDQIAEKHIQKAIEQGEFEDLPGSGKPLKLDDDSMVPKELRAGYRLLKNAGFIPPELQLRKEIQQVEELISVAQTAGELDKAQKRMRYLMMKLEMTGGDSVSNDTVAVYRDRIALQFKR